MFTVLAIILRLWRRERFDIGRAINGVPDVYLTRWTLWGRRLGGSGGSGRRWFLHYFHRSDYEHALHDHPWDFVSLVVWPGYFEVTENDRKWYGPLSVLRREAAWRHRVEIAPGRHCWSLVCTGRKLRHWGFWCRSGDTTRWKWHRAFGVNEQAGRDGCQDG